MYFLARCVKTDAWEKRNKKGYAFIICDEELTDLADGLAKEVMSFAKGAEQEDDMTQLLLRRSNL